MLVTNAQGLIIAINPAFTTLTGYGLAEVKGKTPSVLSSGKQGDDFYGAMWDSINTSGEWQGEIWNRRKSGEIYPEWLTINTIVDDHGQPHRRVALFSDISKHKETEALIWKQAHFDSLTGLPNRQMFYDRLNQELKKSHHENLPMALLFLDLDRFKEVNDSLGHDAGDLLLIETTKRIQSCVREADTVSRLGGDEFTIILGELKDHYVVERIAKDILKKLVMPFELAGSLAYVSASIGITFYPNDGDVVETLIKNADQAMYAAKALGRNQSHYFTPQMQEAAQKRLTLINDLHIALDQQQFLLHYQPIIELKTGRIHKAEALVRWQHPVRGMVSPADFISIAEETDLIVRLGEWVFLEAVKQLSHWQQVCPLFQMSINTSPLQFQRQHALSRDWMQQLQAVNLSGSNLIVEITESLLMDVNDSIKQQLLDFSDNGIQVAMDDFGTGYSSLSYLKKFDIDYIKIDQSFVRNMAFDDNDLALCEAIVVMAHKLGIKVVAEGIETQAQRDLLLAMGCDYGQGYLFSRPVTAEQFSALLVAQQCVSS
jgi:diguanylate cyclase (GGDEF)-like protein/PAS domain S-box-containing protein